MLPWLDPNTAQPYVLPMDQSEPRTVFWFKVLTYEGNAKIIAMQERRQAVGLMAHQEENDPELRKAVNEAHVEAFGEFCTKIENAPGPDGSRTLSTKDEIRGFLRGLPVSWYTILTTLVHAANTMKSDLGKESASPPLPAA
ncbi:MAG: hypothetical protein KC729_00130 [Candidatus Eisenbacteria bacterium]|uniref:Uncharacterized protein n=1 Tax=Eiseniibacteriota bacterium TaxID=2212470 RepID=A0A956RN78_UNCEI|nr:hypothetical protein [Candidatus Eisenbacteria bacterium]